MADENKDESLDLDENEPNETVAGDAAEDKAAAPADEPTKAAAAAAAEPDEIDELEADIAKARETYGAEDPTVKALERSATIARKQRDQLKAAEPVVRDKQVDSQWSKFMKANGADDAPAHVASRLSRSALETKLAEYQTALRSDPDYAGDDRAIAAVATDRLKNYIRRTKREPAPVKTTDKQEKARESGQTHRTSAGGRLAPPGGAGGARAPKQEVTPEDEFVEIVRNAGGAYDPTE